MHSRSFPELAVASQTVCGVQKKTDDNRVLLLRHGLIGVRSLHMPSSSPSGKHTHTHTHTDRQTNSVMFTRVHRRGVMSKWAERASLSCTDVPFITRRCDITGPGGSRALEPRLLHTRLQKAVLLGEAHKPATGVSA